MKCTIFIVLICLLNIEIFAQAKAKNVIKNNKSKQITAFNIKYAAIQKTIEVGKYAQAISEAQQFLNNAQIIFGKRDTCYANALWLMGVAYYYGEQAQKAMGYFEQEIQVRKIIQNQSSKNYIDAQGNLAAMYLATHQYAKAEPMLVENLALRQKYLSGRINAEYLNSFANVALVYDRQGKWDKALGMYYQALSNYKKAKLDSSIDYADMLEMVGVLHQRLYKYDSASYYVQKAYNVSRYSLVEAHPKALKFAFRLINLKVERGGGFNLDADYVKIENLYETVYGAESGSMAAFYSNKSIVDIRYGRYPQAVENLKKALKIYHKLRLNHLAFYGTVTNNLSLAYHGQNKLDSALSYNDSSLMARRRILDFNHPDLLAGYCCRATILIDRKDFGQAGLYMDTLSKKLINNDKIGAKAPIWPFYLKNKALLAEATNQKKEAKAAFNYAIERQLSLNPETTHPDYSLLVYQLALFYWRNDSISAASATFEKVSKVQTKNLRNWLSFMNEKEKLSCLASERLHFEHYANFIIQYHLQNPGLSADLYNLQLSHKGLSFENNTLLRKKNMLSRDTATIAIIDKWQQMRQKIANISTRENSDKDREQLTKLSLSADSLEKILTNVLKQDEIIFETFDWKKIQSKLKKNEAAIEMVRTRKYLHKKQNFDESIVYYAALIIRPEYKYPVLVWFKNGYEMENRFLSQYTNAINFKTDDPYSYKAYWQPFEKYLKKVKKLYFSPDGVYYQINLNTLKLSEKANYIGDKIEIVQLNSSKELLSYQSKININTASLYGFPDFDLGNSKPATFLSGSLAMRSASNTAGSASKSRTRSSLSDFESLAQLPGTKVEIDQISPFFNDEKYRIHTFMASEATEANIKQEHSPKILHIATHGFFLDNNYEKSNSDNNINIQNPLLYSGLLMAGANCVIEQQDGNPQTEDGVLTAYEAQNLALDSTHLVTLSACETAGGVVYNGHGIFGLQYAFKTAGAKLVLMSLWKIDDQATALLMRNFYKYYLTNNDARLALRQATLEMRAIYPHPYYWGAFVVTGLENQ